jgi:hypothetical protein
MMLQEGQLRHRVQSPQRLYQGSGYQARSIAYGQAAQSGRHVYTRPSRCSRSVLYYRARIDENFPSTWVYFEFSMPRIPSGFEEINCHSLRPFTRAKNLFSISLYLLLYSISICTIVSYTSSKNS